MGSGREFDGKDLDDAVRAAAGSLGIPPGELRYEVVEGGRRGVFGLGARRVRIRVDPSADEAPSSLAGPVTGTVTLPAEQSDFEETVHRMLRLAGLDVWMRTAPIENGVSVELGGRDREILLQKEGELLSSLQFVLNRMARRTWPGIQHVVLECEGYRDRRDEDLVELAREVARQVARTGLPKKLHSMNPYERRLVHMTVREFPNLTTRSVGDGFLKQITVAPADRGRNA